MPEHTRAYRFVYPTLLTAGTTQAYLHDVRTGSLVQTFEGLAGLDVWYVELSAIHVFVCTARALRIFSRETGQPVLDIPSDIACARNLVAPPTLCTRKLLKGCALMPRSIHEAPAPYDRRDDIFAGMCVPYVQTLIYDR